MKAPLAAVVLLHLSIAAFAQQSTTAEMEARFKEIQRKTDSVMNSPRYKDMMKRGSSVNTDSLIRSAMSKTNGGAPGSRGYGGSTARRPDTNVAKLPPKDTRTLAALPQKPLSAAALQQYATALDKQLTPAFRKAYGTTLTNTDKYSPATLSNAAAIAAEMGMLDQAILLALKAVERDPHNPTILNNAGSLLHSGGLEIAAIPMLQTAEQDNPGNSTVENNLGQSYLSLGDRDKATHYFQAAIAASPNHPLANTSLAMIEIEKGSRQSALTHVENSLRGGFTDIGWHLLFKLKKDPVLMDYFKARYKPPVYFDEDKYHLPFQCEQVKDIPQFRAEYDAYHQMLDRAKRQFDEEGRQESEQGKQEMMQKVKNFKPGDMLSTYSAPFMELASAMLLDIDEEFTKDDGDAIARAQKKYKTRIQELQDEYRNKSHDAHECGAQIDLANEYMEKMAVETRTYQKAYLNIWEDYYHNNTYWSFFTSNNAHLRKAAFYRLSGSLLSVLQQLAETHFLDVGLDCASKEKKKKEPDSLEIKAECPLGEDGIELPFVIGKFNLNCEETEFEIGEAIVLNVKHNFRTGETIWAIGPGVGVSMFGHSEESETKIPMIGPFVPGADASIKGQLFFAFNRSGALEDWGAKFIAEIDVKGWAHEMSTGYSIGSNSGLVLEPGAVKDAIDEVMGPPKEKQLNKNVPIYNPK